MDAALATLPLETLQARRSEALDALHQLRTGKKTVSLGLDGRSRTFQTVEDLERYIGQIQAAIDAKDSGRPTARRPIHPRIFA